MKSSRNGAVTAVAFIVIAAGTLATGGSAQKASAATGPSSPRPAAAGRTGAAAVGKAPAKAAGGVVLSASPTSLTGSELACRPTKWGVSMTNTGTAGVFADATLTAEAPITLSDQVFSTYLPAADPDRPVTRQVSVRVPPGTPAGSYDLTAVSGRQKVVVPLTVEAVPEPGPGVDLAFGRKVTASSTHGNFTTCAAVDGDSDYRHWGSGYGWNDGDKAVFPDWLAVEWPEPVELGRIETVTYGTPARPAALQGIKDFDVQVRSGGDWLTVGSYRANTLERVVTTFDPVATDAIRIYVHASNSADYSRILEVEAYAPQ
ncbi:discoidin domain-containing protein [uncultured Streptomyces sp.]|uniref:discoidin domain-containing protein n=1 Tax=uncultured Streptomyces sp. TaxID=174707 RepID=UPI0026089FDD|nr:discoidin domain-containing protein [uncultured Streptomyces sp.]